MASSPFLDLRAGPAERAAPQVRIDDDKAMLRAAAELTRDLVQPRPAIYWGDMLASAVIGYGALVAAILAPSIGWAILAGVVAALALYRAESFIHELTHIKHSAVPGFRLAWNLIVGIPLLTPSFMYEGVHNLHHARTRYGTVEDPEYLPLALMKWWTLPVFILVSALAPVALLIRYAVLSPLSAVIPPLRRAVVARYSGLQINPSFRRRPPEGPARSLWHRLETAASIYAIALIVLTAMGIIPLKAFLIFLVVASGLAVTNQVRTLVAAIQVHPRPVAAERAGKGDRHVEEAAFIVGLPELDRERDLRGRRQQRGARRHHCRRGNARHDGGR